MPSWMALLGSDVIQLPPGLMREAWLPSRDAQHLAGNAEAGGWPVPGDPASKNGSCTGPAARSRCSHTPWHPGQPDCLSSTAAGRPPWDTGGPVLGGGAPPQSVPRKHFRRPSPCSRPRGLDADSAHAGRVDASCGDRATVKRRAGQQPRRAQLSPGAAISAHT